MRVRVLSLNIHKGFGWSKNSFTIELIRSAIRHVGAEVVFLQEVLGHHTTLQKKLGEAWPSQAQFEFLADEVWDYKAYAQNAVYPEGHHGNAILSKFPILSWENEDISTNSLESRGSLHAELSVHGKKMHAICVHLNIFAPGRRLQYQKLRARIDNLATSGESIVVAGDFNDWDQSASSVFEGHLHMKEAYKSVTGDYATTFPARFPFLKLDRIYVRELNVLEVGVLKEERWRAMSDHVALTALLESS